MFFHDIRHEWLWNCTKSYKKNNQVRKQKTKRYNYKTEILGCFINQQLLTKTKQRMKKIRLIISFRHTP